MKRPAMASLLTLAALGLLGWALPVAVRARAPARRPGRVAPVPLLPLTIKGHRPAVYVPPAGRGRQPVLVLLHGVGAQRDEACRRWGRVGPRFGWLLCPAGVLQPDTSPTNRRFTYGKVKWLVSEIREGLRSLRARHPGRVATRRLTLVGFSLGAFLAPEVAYFSPKVFQSLVLVEGVRRIRQAWAQRLAQRGVRRVAYLCGEKNRCALDARRRAWYLRRAGLKVRIFTMPGVGHGYPKRFDTLGAQVLRWVRAR